MTLLCGWCPADPALDAALTVAAMGRALRVNPAQTWGCWAVPGLAVGLLELPEAQPAAERYAPAVSADGRYHLWLAGEAFAGGGHITVPSVEASRTPAFRHALLDALLAHGVDVVAELDGEYQIVLWDAAERGLTLLNDRFGGLPLYWARSPQGFAFAGGVRGVLMAPDVSSDPDADALREAVTFGGFRLGDRTNVAGVKMVAGGSVLTVVCGTLHLRRYWSWSDIPDQPVRPMAQLVESVQALWQRAVRRRLDGAARPGQTLSGGLDSRAILAEAAPQVSRWTAITYGLPGCDDARWAERAAAAVGATWVFHPLYGGGDPDWLDRRTAAIQPTDGLIDLVDLMHLETLPLQAALLDVHLSGYIGDAVAGATFNAVTTAQDVLISLPWYATPIGMDWLAAAARVAQAVQALDGSAARFALFEHKLPQSTNRWSAAWRPWLRVRKPFVDYAFFDFCQGLPRQVRGDGRLRERWLRASYPHCFATIPNQRTGVPAMSPQWRIQIERGRRVVWRALQPWLARIGLPARPRVRAYQDDDRYARLPASRQRIEGTILRPGSLVCEILGRQPVAAVVADWVERAAAPAQVIGALYVYEAYHRDLGAHLRAAQSPE
jgi:asparagine synthase (glutamine-hydrolysing)